MINPIKLLKLKESWNNFKQNHPKFPKFLEAIDKNALQEGTVFEFRVTDKDGKEYTSNIKLKESDITLMHEIKNMFS